MAQTKLNFFDIPLRMSAHAQSSIISQANIFECLSFSLFRQPRKIIFVFFFSLKCKQKYLFSKSHIVSHCTLGSRHKYWQKLKIFNGNFKLIKQSVLRTFMNISNICWKLRSLRVWLVWLQADCECWKSSKYYSFSFSYNNN